MMQELRNYMTMAFVLISHNLMFYLNHGIVKILKKLSAYKDEYSSCFPVHESSEAILQIPSLDDCWNLCCAKAMEVNW